MRCVGFGLEFGAEGVSGRDVVGVEVDMVW